MSAPSGVIIVTCEYAPFPGGIGVYAVQIAEAVAAGGHFARVIAPDYDELGTGAERGEDVEDASFSRLRVERLLRHHAIPLRAIPKVLAILRRQPADWPLLAADIRSLLLIAALQPLHRRPYRVAIHGSEVSKLTRRSPFWSLVRAAYRRAERIAANSQATLDLYRAAMQARSGCAHSRESVIYPGISASAFQIEDPVFDNPKLAALPTDVAVICAVGRIEPRKGQLQAVQAVAQARDAHGLANPVLVLAGRPETPDALAVVAAEASRLNIALVAPGRVSDADIRRLYRRSACHLLLAQPEPGRIEGFGLVLLEAAAQHCPSVATRVGGIPEAMGPTGVLVDPGDIDAAAAAMAAYASYPDRRHSDGQKAQTWVRGFDWFVCADALFPELGLGARPRDA